MADVAQGGRGLWALFLALLALSAIQQTTGQTASDPSAIYQVWQTELPVPAHHPRPG